MAGEIDFSDLEGVEVESAQPSQGEAFARGVAQGATFGFADEAAGALDAVVRPGMFDDLGKPLTAEQRADRDAVQAKPFGERIRGVLDRLTGDYEEGRDASRAAYDEAAKAHPYTTLGGQVVGGSVPMLIPGVGATTAGGRILTSAALGGVQGVGSSKADTLGGLAKDSAIGAGVGGAFGAAGEALGAGFRAVRGALQRRGVELADEAAEAAEDAATTALGRAQKRADLSPEVRATQEADEAVKRSEAALRETRAAPKADPVIQQADDAARGLKIARSDLDASPEAQSVSAAKQHLESSRRAFQGLKAKWGSSDEVQALQQADDAVKQTKAALDETKRSWEASPERRHTVEAEREHAFLRRQHDALMAIRRNDEAVQRATREAWSVRSGWDDQRLDQLLPAEARAVLKALDREALQTIRAHGLTPAINRAKGAMKRAEKKAATSRTAAAADEKAALEAINRAERVWRTAQTHLDKMRSASSAQVYEAERKAAERAVKQAEAVLRQAEKRLSASPLSANLRSAEARAKQTATQAERARLTHTRNVRQAEEGVRSARTQAQQAQQRAQPVLQRVSQAREQAEQAGRRALDAKDALDVTPETFTSRLFQKAAHHKGAATGLGAGGLGAAALTGNPFAIGAGIAATVLPWAVSNPSAVKALEVLARGSGTTATYAGHLLRDPAVRGLLDVFPEGPEPTQREIEEADEVIRRAIEEDDLALLQQAGVAP